MHAGMHQESPGGALADGEAVGTWIMTNGHVVVDIQPTSACITIDLLGPDPAVPIDAAEAVRLVLDQGLRTFTVEEDADGILIVRAT